MGDFAALPGMLSSACMSVGEIFDFEMSGDSCKCSSKGNQTVYEAMNRKQANCGGTSGAKANGLH